MSQHPKQEARRLARQVERLEAAMKEYGPPLDEAAVIELAPEAWRKVLRLADLVLRGGAVLLVLLMVACGPCEPVSCVPSATPNVCACGAAQCTVCLCTVAEQCSVEVLDCASGRVVAEVCRQNGGAHVR
jgi:hypothetical protein